MSRKWSIGKTSFLYEKYSSASRRRRRINPDRVTPPAFIHLRNSPRILGLPGFAFTHLSSVEERNFFTPRLKTNEASASNWFWFTPGHSRFMTASTSSRSLSRKYSARLFIDPVAFLYACRMTVTDGQDSGGATVSLQAQRFKFPDKGFSFLRSLHALAPPAALNQFLPSYPTVTVLPASMSNVPIVITFSFSVALLAMHKRAPRITPPPVML